MRTLLAIFAFGALLLADPEPAFAFGRRAPQFKAEATFVQLENGAVPVPCKEVRKRRNEAEDLLDDISLLTDEILEGISIMDSQEDYRDLIQDLEKLSALRVKLQQTYPASWNDHDRGQAMTWVIPLPELVEKLSGEEKRRGPWKIVGTAIDTVLLNKVQIYSQIQLSQLFNDTQAVVRGYWPLSPVNACLTKLSLRVSATVELKDSQGAARKIQVRLAN